MIPEILFGLAEEALAPALILMALVLAARRGK